MTQILEVHDRTYDLSDPRDLTEIEHMSSRPDKFKFLVDEPMQLPFRHIRFKIVNALGAVEVKEMMYDLCDSKALTEIEHMCARPEKFTFVVDETVLLPFRHIRFEVLRPSK